VRWRHPTYGLIPPMEFVPLAEQTGLMPSIGRWVLEESCHQVRFCQREHPSDPPPVLNVNVFACPFRQPNLVEEILRLENTGLDPTALIRDIDPAAIMEE
jgi:EAL domain-containing protein (putative c-di-GMP-specific phosphodiesterase class I)